MLKDGAAQMKTGELSSVEITQGMRIPDGVPHSTRDTSNDLLFTLHGVYSPRPLNYEVVAQSADEVQDISNAPALSMGSYLYRGLGTSGPAHVNQHLQPDMR